MSQADLPVLSFPSALSRVPGLTYLDKGKDPKNPETKVETRDAITFGSYVDSVYLNAPNHVALEVDTALTSYGLTSHVGCGPLPTPSLSATPPARWALERPWPSALVAGKTW